MSRCFPYPPPGYTLSKASNEALIESIKLQKEREKAKEERKKEKKREKKEKKKHKEEKTKQTKAGHFDHDVKGDVLQKETKDDAEQLERSSVTEEQGKPVCLHNPSCSSDSTQNSSKRKRHASPLKGTHTQGNILRIRLASQKHIQNDIRDREKQLCSTSARTDVPAEHKNDAARADPDKTCSISLATDIVHSLPLTPDQELTRPNSFQQPDISSQEIKYADSGSKRQRKLKRVIERYRDLIETWVPPCQQSEHTGIDDDDWLFGSKHQAKHPEKKIRLNGMLPCSSGTSLWPQGHYLNDADVYALPYTVPF